MDHCKPGSWQLSRAYELRTHRVRVHPLPVAPGPAAAPYFFVIRLGLHFHFWETGVLLDLYE